MNPYRSHRRQHKFHVRHGNRRMWWSGTVPGQQYPTVKPLKCYQRWNDPLTICNFTVLPSSSMVRIFCPSSVSSNVQPWMLLCVEFLQNQLQWLRYSSPYRYRRQSEVVDTTFRLQSHRWGAAWRDSRICQSWVSLTDPQYRGHVASVLWK